MKINLILLSAIIIFYSMTVAADTPPTITTKSDGNNIAIQSNASLSKDSQKYNENETPSPPQDRPPQSGLGMQMEPPQVVYPSSEQVVQQTLNDLDGIQLTPDQINQLKLIKQRREAAKATPYVTPPKPVTRTEFINLNAGVSPPTLRLSRGQLSTVVFSDTNGQPWNISHVSDNCTLFRIDTCDGQTQQGQGNNQIAPTNILTIEPLRTEAYGNITITLNGLATPVIFILTSGQEEVDMRVDAKIPGRNPDAKYSIEMTNMPGIDSDLTYFLDGVPPKSARRLKVTGLDGVDAWEYNNYLYVRANADAQYPAYTKSARSTTGLSIYRFDDMPNSVTFTAEGRAVTVFIEIDATQNK
jgi:intracellular multiplication protein IcmK